MGTVLASAPFPTIETLRNCEALTLNRSVLRNECGGCTSAHGDDVFGEQLLGSSDWPDFEGDAAFTVPPKPMPELYSLRGDQV